MPPPCILHSLKRLSWPGLFQSVWAETFALQNKAKKYHWDLLVPNEAADSNFRVQTLSKERQTCNEMSTCKAMSVTSRWMACSIDLPQSYAKHHWHVKRCLSFHWRNCSGDLAFTSGWVNPSHLRQDLLSMIKPTQKAKFSITYCAPGSYNSISRSSWRVVADSGILLPALTRCQKKPFLSRLHA